MLFLGHGFILLLGILFGMMLFVDITNLTVTYLGLFVIANVEYTFDDISFPVWHCLYITIKDKVEAILDTEKN